MNKGRMYDRLWQRGYVRAAQDILNLLSETDRNKLAWRCDCSENMKSQLLIRYNEYREIVHRTYFKGEEDQEILMDIHKVCACFAKSIVDLAPMSFKVSDDIPWPVKASNYMLAFYSSIHMLYEFLVAEYCFCDMGAFADVLIKKKKFDYPVTSTGHDVYTKGRVKAIATQDIYDTGMDILSYADMLFWIELYNRQIIEGSINLKPFDFIKYKDQYLKRH